MPYDEILCTIEPHWNDWAIHDLLTIRECALLLTGENPNLPDNRVLPPKAGALVAAMLRAIRLGKLMPLQCLAWNDDNWQPYIPCELNNPRLSDATEVLKADLARWADANGFTHGWPPETESATNPSVPDLSRFPVKLRAAIEAFHALRDNSTATKGKTAKAAISAWLEVNKPGLSKNARTLVAEVANWQTGGGAPKTPGEG